MFREFIERARLPWAVVLVVVLVSGTALLVSCGGEDAAEEDGTEATEATESAGTTGTTGADAEDQEEDQQGDEAPAVEIKLGHFMSPQHVQHSEVMQPFADEVAKVTDGRVKVTIFPGGALGPPPAQYEAAVQGIQDAAFGLQGYTAGKFVLTGVMELPFMAESAVDSTEKLLTLYEEFPSIQEEYDAVKVWWIWSGDTGQLMTNEPVKTLDDLKGMKIRAPNAAMSKALEAWGAAAVSMPITEVYGSLQKGVVDGTVAPLSTIPDFNFDEVVSHITLGDFYTSTFFVVANKDTWNSISEADREAISGLVGEPTSIKAAEVYDEFAAKGLDIAKESGVEIYELPSDQVGEWQKAAQPVYDDWLKSAEDKGAPAEKILETARSAGE